MTDASRSKSYRYPFSQIVISYLLLPIFSVLGLGLGAFLLEVGSAFFGALLILFGAWLIFLSAFGSLMSASIIVSDEGIAAHNFGRSLKFIRWRDVTKIKKVRRWNAGSRSFEDAFYVFDKTFSSLHQRMVNLRGPIAFTDKIRDLRGLLDKVNEAARRYRFPLVALDQEAARKLAAQSGAGVWARTVPKVHEVLLTDF